MKIIGKIMIAAGIIAVYGAAGRDGAYGMEYPLHELICTVLVGIALIGIGAVILKMKGERNGRKSS